MTERTRFIAYLTKYALTKGIEVVEVEDCFHISPNMVHTGDRKHGGAAYHGLDWHRTREEALARAEVMRLARLKMLKRQVEQFEAMKFV